MRRIMAASSSRSIFNAVTPLCGRDELKPTQYSAEMLSRLRDGPVFGDATCKGRHRRRADGTTRRAGNDRPSVCGRDSGDIYRQSLRESLAIAICTGNDGDLLVESTHERLPFCDTAIGLCRRW